MEADKGVTLSMNGGREAVPGAVFLPPEARTQALNTNPGAVRRGRQFAVSNCRLSQGPKGVANCRLPTVLIRVCL